MAGVTWRGRSFKSEEERNRFAYRNRERLLGRESFGRIFGHCIWWFIAALVIGMVLLSLAAFWIVLLIGIIISATISQMAKHDVIRCAEQHAVSVAKSREQRAKQLRELRQSEL